MHIHKFQISPSLPQKLLPLKELAYNLRWTWDPDTIELFRRISKDLWESTGHNPVRLLGEVDQARLEALAEDEGFLVHMLRVSAELRRHLKRKTWFHRTYHAYNDAVIAYFSAEFGLTECMPIYSGGLGILAGDHVKSCSELGLPLVGVGLLYQEGYFQQYLTNDGWQQERYPVNDFHTMPVVLERTEQGDPLTVQVEMASRQVAAQVWRAQVGRIPLYFLDTNIPVNSPSDQDISDGLYGGDREMRIQQELLLGVGGLRALRLLGHVPTVCHMNEGHSAFLALERIHGMMKRYQLNFDEARNATEAGNVFTTHTPVPAGIDVFPVDLVETYLRPYAERLGIEVGRLVELGRAPGNGDFSMAVLAIRLSNRINGVSRLHGRISRQMFGDLWPDAPQEEAPIGHVTNGIHARSWISFEMASLYDRYLGPRWTEDPSDQSVWESVLEIPDAELWRTHERRRERLVAFARRSLVAQLQRRGVPDTEVDLAREVLDPSALTIGFARRFAPYKRGTLLFRDFERLVKILTDAERPVQLIFAGKAHPQDENGKGIIRSLISFLRDARIRTRAVFLENYDMRVSRYLVQGVDIWLNTPRRPHEASGTSGMKATANGGLNVSVLDGWWDEAYAREVGWAIGRGEEYQDEAYQDMVESRALYDLLENDIVPLFYKRGSDDIPRGWTAKMKEAMRRLCPSYNTNRMVCDYVNDYYRACADRSRRLTAENAKRARELTTWKQHVRTEWDRIRIQAVRSAGSAKARVGDKVKVECEASLAGLEPSDVSVEIYHGRVDGHGEIHAVDPIAMQPVSRTGEGNTYSYAGTIECRHSGQVGFAVRVLPAHEDLLHPHAMRLITWAE
ncbi:MAG: alpha-glucan family phosphorylase [Candidatus Eisenbacteria sp.]|nr:alpha-glucan family phosphorylase [Candidatus Eisenbacteria bacterium]